MVPTPTCPVCQAPKWKRVINRYVINEKGQYASEKIVDADYVPGEQEVVVEVFCSSCGIIYHLQSV